MTAQMKRKIARCIEIRLGGKPFSLYIDHAGFVVNNERVANLESECGETLPADYKEFLLAYNGARLLDLDNENSHPTLSFISNIKEVSDFGLLGSILEGQSYERNSLVLIGSNHDGSVYTLMRVNGKQKGEIYQYTRGESTDCFKQPAYKSFSELLHSVAKSEYGKQVAKSGIVSSKANSPARDEEPETPKFRVMPINSKKFPLLSEVVNNLFEKVETEENEYGRILTKNKQDKTKIILIMTYVRDILHEQRDNDIQSYLDFFSPFKLYLISESELEEIWKDGLIDENDEITQKGIEETEKLIVEESEKLASLLPKREPSARPSFKGCVDVTLGGKSTALQLTQIGTLINESRLKKFEKDLGTSLPKDYREFLLGYNGGTAKQTNLIIDGNIETAGIKIFRDLQTLEERIFTGGSQNLEWLAIGTDKMEHLVYLNLKGEKRGCIYRYKHEEEDGPESTSQKFTESFTDVPKQLLAKNFLEFVLNVVSENKNEEGKDEEDLDAILPTDIKVKYPQFVDVMWTLYNAAEKHESKVGRITLPHKQDVQNVILLVKLITSYNLEAFVTVMNHTPFRFFTVLDTHIEEMKKAKLLSSTSLKLTKKGREEAERLLIETKIMKPDLETDSKKGKKKDAKSPKTPPKSVTEKNLKRKLEDNEGRHTRSSTKEGSAAKKR